MVDVLYIEVMASFTMNKKSAPSAYKLGSKFDPYVLNPRVLGRSVVQMSR